MEEVASPGEVERDAGRTAGLDRLVVTNGTTRLDDRSDMGVDEHLGAVGEREKRVGSGNRSGGTISGPLHSELAGVNPVHLPHADTH